MVALFIMCGFGSAQNINVIEKELQEILNRRSDEMVEVTIMMKSQIEAATLKAKVVRTDDKSLQKEIVVGELKDFAKNTQNDVMAVLNAEEASGNVSDINALWIVNAISCKATRDVIYNLASHPDIAALSYNKEIQLIDKEEMEYEEEVTRGTGGTAPYLVNANSVWWGQGYTGKNVVVAVLDSGTNYYHHAIRNNLWEGEYNGEIIHGWNAINNNSDIIDEYGHGTHCGGIVCGSNDVGVAPDAKLMTVKIVGRAGTGSVAQMLNGVQWAIENGANILSMSLGFKSNHITKVQKESIRAAFDNVLLSNVIVCAAAGNDGTSYGAPKNIDYPAACPSPWRNPDQTLEGGLSSVVCVGAHDLAASSQGPSTWQDTEYNDYPYSEEDAIKIGLIRPDISAPGNLIYSLNHTQVNKYKLMSGTSQATPMVAGVIALMLEKNPNLTPEEICEILETTAVSKPTKKNNVIGSGHVEALNAVNAVDAQNQKAFIKLESFTPKSTSQGTTQELVIKMRNIGKGTNSQSTTVLLETISPYITINTPTATLATLNPGSTKEVAFTINISEEAPNNHSAYFTVTTTDESFKWTDNFAIKVSSISDIVYSSVDPSVIEIGEEVDINVSMKNIGNGPMNGNTSLKLLTTSYDLNNVTLIDDEATLGPIGAGETAVGTFTIKAHNDAVSHNYPIDFFLQINSSTQSSTFDIVYEFENDMEGWTTFDANYGDTVNNPYFHSNDAFLHNKTPKHSHSGTGHIMSETMAYSEKESATPINNYFVSPKTKVSSNSKISFWARAHYDVYYAEHFGVAVSENSNNDDNDFETIEEWEITQSQGSEWYKYTADLSEYAGKEIYIAIRHFFSQEQWNNLYNGYYVDALNIDDIVISDVSIDFNFTPTYSNDDKTYFNVNISNPLDAVTGLVATADTIDGTDKINLKWNEVDRAKSYNIYRDNVLVANTTTTSYTDSNLQHNTEYCYEVAAVGGGFTFERSEKVCAATLQKDYSVAIQSVTPTNVFYDGNNINLSITFVNDGKKEHQSRCYFDIESSDEYVTVVSEKQSNGFLNAGDITTKNFTIRLDEEIPNDYEIAFNAKVDYMFNPQQGGYDGPQQSWVIPFTIFVKNDPNTPKGLTANASENSVTLNWNPVADAIRYNVYRNGEYVETTSVTTYYDGGLESDTEYKYQVSSITASGESELCKETAATTLAASNGIVLQSFTMGTAIGQEVELTATMINNSSEATPEATTATLTCDDPYVTIVDATADLGSMAAGATATATFIIKLDANIPSNYNLNFDVTTEYEGEGVGNGSKHYTFDNGFEGWITSDLNNNGETWYHSSNSASHSPSNPGAHSGSGHLMNATYCSKHYVYDANDIIWSPEKIKIGDKTKISFHVRSTASSNTYCNDSYYIVYSTSQTNPSNFDNMFVYNKLGPDEKGKWNFKEHNLSSQSGNEVWVGIWHEADESNADGLCIDEITISNIMIEGVSTISKTSSFSVTANQSLNIFAGTGLWSNASLWSKGLVPTSTDDVIINGDAIIEEGNINVNSVSIEEGTLTMDGGTLTVAGLLLNTDADAFIINDGAQVFQNNDNVAATFVMNIHTPKSWSVNKTEGWQFISSPITNANISDFKPQSETDYDLFKYDGTQEGTEWVNYKGHINEFEKIFQEGRGYIASYEAETTADFVGILNNASSYTFENISFDSEGSWANFHLLGNPFSFDMDWSEVSLENVYNGFATVNPSTGGYVISQGEGSIPVGDGFFVETIGEEPSISYNTGSKSRGEEKADYINIIATGAEGSNNLIVKFSGADEKGFSKLENINTNIADIFVKNNGRQYSILSYDRNVQEIELFFDAKQMGNYSISLDINGKFGNVTLVDRLTGIETNMLLEDEYSFTATSNENPNRFVLLINDDSTSTSLSNFAYINNRDIVIYDINGNANIKIFDAMGRCVFNGSCTDAIHRVPAEGFSAGVYVIQKVDDNGVNVQKIIL